jgi:hypothetical protein
VVCSSYHEYVLAFVQERSPSVLSRSVADATAGLKPPLRQPGIAQAAARDDKTAATGYAVRRMPWLSRLPDSPITIPNVAHLSRGHHHTRTGCRSVAQLRSAPGDSPSPVPGLTGDVPEAVSPPSAGPPDQAARWQTRSDDVAAPLELNHRERGYAD